MNNASQIMHDMDHFFKPNGVAVIGATDNAKRGGFHLLRNVLGGYTGKVYPVNPKYAEIMGVPCYPDVASIPDDFDLAIYFIPAASLPETIRECAKKKVRAIIIESAGFSETGEEGRKLQQRSVELARSLGIRLWGPNCMGLLDAHSRNVFSFMYNDRWKTLLAPGNVSLIVQSGMLSAGFLMTMMERGGMGMSKIASIGNKCDVNETELLEYFINDEKTEVIGCYLESIVDGRRFMDLARKTSKPIVVLKSGRSPQGARAAMSHTASLSGSSKIYDGAFRQAGIIQVFDLNELMDFIRGFSHFESCPDKGGTAVVTFSGGAGIVTADLLSDRGLQLADLAPETLREIKKVFPEWMEPAHPLDLWPAVEKNGLSTVYNHTVEAAMKDPAVDTIIVESIAAINRGPEFLAEIGRMKKRYGKPVLLWLIHNGQQDVFNHYRKIAEEAGVPEFTEISRIVAIIAGVKRHYRKKRSLGVLP
ncbi:MAG TPA: CoA-binding protein [Spirochaetota bacterium]|nr:CoA-binding protein [Spirochaetota bacterium]HRZ25955.1 CoA-binding protein [Spirochaetota bacterium]